ncbi:MAG TPA: 3'(2'),5'-bisphosphate nucleotidase CysQ [Gammaproteobacteria bacterium]|jgi:myo-inositol-1(or 4)-monophosphatase|nr:3'(2'),5'-bisphosphate nucleotidase CysQ [Gammaproteobacteria bacterium]
MFRRERTVLLDAVQQAGKAAEQIRKKGFSVDQKANCSPVTEADLLVNALLKEALCRVFPQYGWLSEETKDDESRLGAQYTWIVDPIDGTKEFTKDIPEFAISVALVVDQTPVLACVYNPATEELFYAIKNEGAWYNHQRMFCLTHSPAQLHILASRTECQAGDWDGFRAQYRIQETGSIAYKLALVACGKANATFSLTPKSEWDIAAGVLLVQEAGGWVRQLDGSSFLFNQKNVLRSGIIACHPNVYAVLFPQIEKIM